MDLHLPMQNQHILSIRFFAKEERMSGNGINERLMPPFCTKEMK
jgi:hypothetical protein